MFLDYAFSSAESNPLAVNRSERPWQSWSASSELPTRLVPLCWPHSALWSAASLLRTLSCSCKRIFLLPRLSHTSWKWIYCQQTEEAEAVSASGCGSRLLCVEFKHMPVSIFSKGARTTEMGCRRVTKIVQRLKSLICSILLKGERKVIWLHCNRYWSDLQHCN